MRLRRSLLVIAALAGPLGAISSEPAPVVRVSIETNGLPFSDRGPDGRPVGFSAELLQAAADAEGLKLEWDLRPWDEILADFRAGNVQLLGNVAYSEERDRFIDFSLPNFTMRGGFFIRRRSPPLASAADLRGRRVAVLRDSIGHDHARARQAEWQCEIVPVADRNEGVEALREGRCDALMVMLLVTQHYLREQQIDDIVAASLPADELNYRLHFGVREGDTALLHRVNAGLLAAHRNGAYDQLYEKWLGPLEPRRLGLRDLRPFALPAVVVAILVAAAFLWQRRMLRRASRQAEVIRRSEERLQLVFAATEDGFWDWDVASGQIVRSDRVARMLGFEPRELPEHPRAIVDRVHPDDAPALAACIEDILAGRLEHFSLEVRVRTRSDEWRWILDRGKAVARGPDGRTLRVVGTLTDITARKEAETESEKLRQKMLDAQKLESLGVLAGGIAHDFNNLLTVILGNTALNQLDASISRETAGRLEKIHTAASRAADLCRQLLAYAGRGTFTIERIRMNDLVHETSRLLEVTIGRRAAIDYALAAELPYIEADPSQMRQVIMNLVINAAEAMPGPDPGHIRLATRPVRLPPGEPAGALPAGGVAGGDYVCIEVSDDGTGMTPEVLGRIFDPFFTTKFTGRGLGLAAVLGIVRSHRGALQVESAPGRGSTFRIYLPAFIPGPVV